MSDPDPTATHDELWAIFKEHPVDTNPVIGCTCHERMTAQRELLEHRINYERDAIGAAQKVIAEALKKQAGEDARHFELLNSNLKMMLAERANYFSIRDHEAFKEQYLAFRDNTKQALTTIYTWGAASMVFLVVLEFIVRLVWK